jgi:hypothetical protein
LRRIYPPRHHDGPFTDDEIAKLGRQQFRGSTATRSDVSWNRSRLRRERVKNVPDAKRAGKAAAKVKPKRNKKAKAGKPPAAAVQEANQ